MGPRGIGCEIVTELNGVNIEPLCITWSRSPVFLYKQGISWTLIRQPTLVWKPCTVKLGMPWIPADWDRFWVGVVVKQFIQSFIYQLMHN